jgi:hypothetical protein
VKGLKRLLLATTITSQLLIPAVAHAVPVAVVTAFLATVGITSTIVATVATFIINTAITFAANTLMTKLTTPKARGASQERQASVLNLSIGEAPPRGDLRPRGDRWHPARRLQLRRDEQHRLGSAGHQAGRPQVRRA